MKRLIFFVLGAFSAIAAMAQSVVAGRVVENETDEALPFATVKLLGTDSTMVSHVLTNSNGYFSLKVPKRGRYLLQVSSVGYNNYLHRLNVRDTTTVNLGTLRLEVDAVMLQEATVTGMAQKVTVVEDTVVYNAAAYRTPEGSVIEELVRRLPGAEVNNDGNIKINGKEVKKIKVDGKEFMTGDTKTAIKNLPTSIVERVKAYEDKSDMARISGIEDGNEEMTLDFTIKRGMNKGFMTNNDLGIGTKDRYSARLMGMWTKDNKWRVTATGNANNVNNRGYGGGGGRGGGGGGRQGLQSSKSAGVNMSYDNLKTFKADGSVQWSHDGKDALSKRASENFVSTNPSFSNSRTQNYSRSNSWSTQFRLEWQPDSMTNIMFRPNASMSSNDGLNRGVSATFSEDPYQYYENPLDDMQGAEILPFWVNSRVNRSLSYGNSKSVGGSLQYNRKLNNNGRNITLRIQTNYSRNENKGLSSNNVELFHGSHDGTDTVYTTNRFNQTPSERYNYSVQAQYSEPLFKGGYLQFRYQFQYTHNKSDRSTFDFSQPNRYTSLGQQFIDLNDAYAAGIIYDISDSYRDWAIMPLLPGGFDNYRVDSLSRYSEYNNYNHTAEMIFRWNGKKHQMSIGTQVLPQHNVFHQIYQGRDIATSRDMVNWSPTANFRYRFTRQHQLRFDYRGNTSQPSMTQLLEIEDDSDPLNKSTGNAGLKPSFTQSFRLNYNNYIQRHTQAVIATLNYSTTRNSIANMVTYDPETGARWSRPENINGNWNASGSFTYNCSIDTLGHWNVNTMTNIGYSNNVAYYSQNRTNSVKNPTTTVSVGERLGAGYRNDWLEIELNGSLNYQNANNELQPNRNLKTWHFNYGGNIDVQLPWNLRINTAVNMSSRRGYSDATLNTNELIWNAQISQSFLRGKALTLMLQLHDILHQQSSFSRNISASSRTDTEYNAITSYAMLHVTFRFNAFGGKTARQGQRGADFGNGDWMPSERRGNGQRQRGGGNRGGWR